MEANTKISDLLETLDPIERGNLERIVTRLGCTPNNTILEVLDKIVATPDWQNGLSFDEKKSVFALIRTDNKFGRKLTHEQHCEILALHQMGIRRTILAKMYGLDERTISHIYNQQSPHYKKVRKEAKLMGEVKFQDKYIRGDILDRALAHQQIGIIEETSNNKYSNNKAGLHVVRGPMCTYDHRVTIQWREPDENIDVAGWYYRDLDGDMPEYWLRPHDNPESCRTSQSCYAAMLKDIADKLQ